MRRDRTKHALARPGLTAALLVALTFCFAPERAQANANCLQNDNQCEPDKLCTFKAQLAEKVFLYQVYLRNSQVTRRRGRREGIRYDGSLYEASVTEARTSFPTMSAEQQMVRAGQIFQEKIRKYAEDNFKLPTCTGNAMNQPSLLPKAGYSGAYTDERCQVWIRFEGGQYNPEGFGANDATPCQEFYDRDRAHEVIHQRSCQAAQKSGKNLDHIDNMIEDEIAAYRHSVLLSKAYLRLLSIRCSALPNPAQLKSRAKRVQDLLTPYLKKER